MVFVSQHGKFSNYTNHFSKHEILVVSEQVDFESSVDFEECKKKNIEEQENASYIKNRGSKTYSDSKVTTINLTIPGNYRRKFSSPRKRKMAVKVKCLLQSNASYPAKIKVVFCNDMSVKVNCIVTRFGLKMELAHF